MGALADIHFVCMSPLAFFQRRREKSYTSSPAAEATTFSSREGVELGAEQWWPDRDYNCGVQEVGGGPGASCVSDKLIILLLSPDPDLSRAETSNFAVSESVKCVLARSCHIQLLILSRIRGCHNVILATQRIIRLHRASVVYREARKQLKGLVSVKCLTRKLCFQQAFNIFCRYLAAASWAPILPWQP